ncbi:MAG: IclR family transcriptional regulator [Clostridia bacterium]|nr:IclR family transcriptional regulator [Clostridia bacterium]
MSPSPTPPIGSLARALRLLEQFTARQDVWGVRELALATGMSKATVSKVMATLRAYGYVVQDPVSRRYRLGPAFISLGRVASRKLNVVGAARPLLERLAAETGETAVLMLRASMRSVCVATAEAPQPIRVAATVGRYASLHAGASNKPILAFLGDEEIEEYIASPFFVPRGPRSIAEAEALRAHLAEIRQRGFATSESEVEPGVSACGAPVFDAAGEVVGAVSITGPSDRLNGEAMAAAAGYVRRAAEDLSRALGWRGENGRARGAEERSGEIEGGGVYVAATGPHRAGGGRAGGAAPGRLRRR